MTELREYHTKTTASGKSEIVKVGDDLLDSLRYAFMMRRHAIRICDLFPEEYAPAAQRSEGYTGD